MKRLAFCLWLICSSLHATPINVPVNIREPNYGPSCGHASVVTELRQLGYTNAAKQWRSTHYGSVTYVTMDHFLDVANLAYVQTLDGDIKFVERCNAAGFLVHVDMWAEMDNCSHAMLVTDINSTSVRLIDVNNPRQDWWMSRSEFARIWTGWAFCIYGTK